MGTKETETNGLNCQDLLMHRWVDGADYASGFLWSSLGDSCAVLWRLEVCSLWSGKGIEKERWMRSRRNTCKNQKWEESKGEE